MLNNRNFRIDPVFIQDLLNRKVKNPVYWVATKDFKYNTKTDRYYDADPMSPRTMEYVKDTVVKKGDTLPKDFVNNKNYLKSLMKFIKPIGTRSIKAEKEKLDPVTKQANLFSNNNLLILAVIVGGYFAYKKFKK